jgi:hypothetical protein
MALSTTTLSTETNPSPQCHINDDIEGVTIPVDEWIAKELARIKEKREPRHCHDYEALIEVIEEISRMPTSMMMTMKQQPPQQPNFNTDTTTNNISYFNDAETDDANDGSAVTLPCSNPSPMLMLLPSPPVSPITSSSMMVLLGRAFISLWKYCWDDQYAPHHPYPVGLLLDIEKITLRLHSNRLNINNNISNNNNSPNKNNNTNTNEKDNDVMNNDDATCMENASRKKILLPAMQGMIQAQLSKAFYIQTPTPPDETPSCLPWLDSFQVIQQWIFPLSIPNEKSTTYYLYGGMYDNTAAATGWYSSFITGMDAYRSAKLSLPFTSHFSHLPATSTVEHLEQLMQNTHP